MFSIDVLGSLRRTCPWVLSRGFIDCLKGGFESRVDVAASPDRDHTIGRREGRVDWEGGARTHRLLLWVLGRTLNASLFVGRHDDMRLCYSLVSIRRPCAITAS